MKPRKQKKLPSERYEKGSEEEIKAAIKKAMNLLLYRDRSAFELKKRLEETGFSGEAIEEALQYTASFGYINDRHFAENYVYSMREKKSRAVIERELENKGISAELIEEALAALPEDESERVYELLLKKAGQPRKIEEKDLRRLYGFILRKGFTSGDFWTAMRRFQAEGEA